MKSYVKRLVYALYRRREKILILLVGLFFGMGMTERVAVVENGETRMKRFLPIGITADERVCSGAHYAAFFADVMHFLAHPEVLEVPPESVKYDPGVEYHVEKVKKPE